MRDRRLQSAKTVVERQQRMAAEGDDHALRRGLATYSNPGFDSFSGMSGAPVLSAYGVVTLSNLRSPYASFN